MSVDEKLIDIISKMKAPKMSKGFWAKFDAELGWKLDAAEAGRISPKAVPAHAIINFFAVFREFKFKRAFVTASFALIVIAFSLIFSVRNGPGLYSVASLTSDELIEELIFIDNSEVSENIIDF